MSTPSASYSTSLVSQAPSLSPSLTVSGTEWPWSEVMVNAASGSVMSSFERSHTLQTSMIRGGTSDLLMMVTVEEPPAVMVTPSALRAPLLTSAPPCSSSYFGKPDAFNQPSGSSSLTLTPVS